MYLLVNFLNRHILPNAIYPFSDCSHILRTVGSKVNGPVTGIARGSPDNDPLPQQEPRPKSRVQRSKSFPWDGPPGLELPQQALPSFEEQDKESPVEVFRISLVTWNTFIRRTAVRDKLAAWLCLPEKLGKEDVGC